MTTATKEATKQTTPVTGIRAICDRQLFVDGLAIVGRAINSRTPKPILSCVKIEATADTLLLSATNLELAITWKSSQVQIEHVGAVCVSFAKLQTVVKGFSCDTFTLELTGDQLRVSEDGSSASIYTQKAAEFPPAPTGIDGEFFSTNATALSAMLKSVLPPVADESRQYAMGGILLSSCKSGLTAVATDGKRLFLAGRRSIAKPDAFCIIPKTAAAAIVAASEHSEAAADVSISENQIRIRIDHTVIASNLVEGAFPPYDDVIPKDCDMMLTVDRASMSAAVSRASALSSISDGKACIRCQLSKSGAKMTGSSPEYGTSESSVAAKYEGANLEIGFNAKFMTEALAGAQCDEVKIGFNAPNRPIRIELGTEFVAVIMPVNLM